MPTLHWQRWRHRRCLFVVCLSLLKFEAEKDNVGKTRRASAGFKSSAWCVHKRSDEMEKEMMLVGKVVSIFVWNMDVF